MATYNGWSNRETWLVNLHKGDYVDYYTDGMPTRYLVARSIEEDVVGEAMEAGFAMFSERGAVESPLVKDLMPDIDEIVRRIDFDELADTWLHDKEWCEECESWFDIHDHEGKFTTNSRDGYDDIYTCGDCANEED